MSRDNSLIRWRKALAIGVALYTAVVLSILLFIGDDPIASDDIYIIPAISGTVIALLLTLRRPDHRLGPLMAIMSGALVTLGLINVVIPWSLERGLDSLTVLAVHLSDLAWVTQFITTLVLLPLWFPTGRALNGRWAWVGRSAIITAALAQVSFIVAGTVCAYSSPASDVCIPVTSPWGIKGFDGFEWLLLVAMAMAFPAAASTFVRWRRSDDIERQQMKWFFLAVIGLLVAFVVAFADFNQVLNEILFAAGLTGIWIAIAIAVLRFRLYEIDRIVSRTVTYAIVVGLLVGAVAGIATFAGAQFQEPWVVAATTLGIAALFNPMRRRVHRWVDRRFNRSRYDTEQVMDEFTESLREQVDTGQVVEGLVDVVGQTMQPAGMGVWVRHS